MIHWIAHYLRGWHKWKCSALEIKRQPQEPQCNDKGSSPLPPTNIVVFLKIENEISSKSILVK